MKTNNTVTLAFVLILIIIGSSDSFGQIPPKYYWRTVFSPTASHLNSINERYIVGENGTILYKTGTDSYTQITGIPNYIFNCVSGIRGVSFYYTAVGNNGVIYYCFNSSNNVWVPQTSGTNANLNSAVTFYSRNPVITRIAVGDGGTILKSITNVPVNWTPWASVTSNTTQNLNAIAPFDSNISVIVGDNGTILRSTNKGNNWSAINSGLTNKLNSIYLTSYLPGNSWITGDNGLILKSTNAGLNWFQVQSGTTANLKSFTPYFICGSNGIALRSLDTGMTWIATQTNITTDLNAIFEATSYVGAVAVGDAGKILRWDLDSSYVFRKLEGNSISSYFTSSGVFNQNVNSYNTSGFEWPKGSGRKAVFTTGLSMSAMVQGQIRQAMAFYRGELTTGICYNGVPFTNDTFKVYSVKNSDNPNTNSDWLNWGLMIPYGAPFVDVNNNGIYEPLIDTPGVKNASQTVFVCMTDGFQYTHSQNTDFGGATLPLYNEVHLTAWCYSQPSYTDMQFLKYEIINKGNFPWTRTYFSFVADPDLGDARDDYIGCDTVRKLGYCYNGDNMDGSGNPPTYGAAPPAVGFLLLKSAYRKYVNPGYIGFTGFTNWGDYSFGFEICEYKPVGEPLGAYYYMMGFKKDSTCWLDPTQSPKKKTKFIFPGDPETNIGWVESKGRIKNCFNDTSGLIIYWAGDRQFALSSGAEDLTVNPGDTQRIVMCQLIARGTNNLNSVTKLKQLSDVAINFYNTNFTIGIKQISTKIPTKFSLSQNYPNPFNPVTKIKFDVPNVQQSLSRPVGTSLLVALKIYDITGREIQTLINEKLQPGTYETTFDGSALSSGVYFYQLTSEKFKETKKLILLK